MTAPGDSPQPFGKYLLIERIAAGGMAEVYRALLRGEAGFEKTIALKRILPVFGDEQDFVTLFQDEARIASTLTHANIVQTFDFGEIGGSWYLALELVEGTDLSRLSARLSEERQPFPTATAAFVVSEAARGLGYAHDKRAADGRSLGIVHRDVSPQNLLVSYSGEVKVADFGIAKAASKVHRTMTGMVMGKMRYMSPEQLAGDPLDPRSDVFSLGVILYELLTGGGLFPEPGARIPELIHAAPILPPSQRNPGVPRELDDIVLRALGRPVETRYARAADLARDLTVWLQQAAPRFTREDLATLVERMVPPGQRRADSALLEVVPPSAPSAPSGQTRDRVITPPLRRTPGAPAEAAKVDPAAATELRQLDVPTRTRLPDDVPATRAAPAGSGTLTDDAPPRTARSRRRRGLSAATIVSLLLIGVIATSAALVLMRFASPGSDTSPAATPSPHIADAALAVLPADAAELLPDAGAATRPAFTLTPTIAEPAAQQRRAQTVDAHDVLRRGVADPDYELVLAALDYTVAHLELDATGRAAAAPALPPWLATAVEERGLVRPLAALIEHLRLTGQLPPLVRAAAVRYLRGRRAFPLRAGGAHGAAALALWLEDPRGDERQTRLLELAAQLYAQGQTCDAARVWFAPAACAPAALAAELRDTGESETAAALSRYADAESSVALPGGGRVSLGLAVWAEASPEQRVLHVELRETAPPGLVRPPPSKPTVLGAGFEGAIPARGVSEGADATIALDFLVPLEATWIVLSFELDGQAVVLRVPSTLGAAPR